MRTNVFNRTAIRNLCKDYMQIDILLIVLNPMEILKRAFRTSFHNYSKDQYQLQNNQQAMLSYVSLNITS